VGQGMLYGAGEMSDTSEEWKPVPGYEGMYNVSSHGRVMSLKRNGVPVDFIKALRPSASYTFVRLKKSGKQLDKAVHRLVLHAFRGTPVFGSQGDHLDQNRSNNMLSNLHWVSGKYNRRKSTSYMALPEDERGEYTWDLVRERWVKV